MHQNHRSQLESMQKFASTCLDTLSSFATPTGQCTSASPTSVPTSLDHSILGTEIAPESKIKRSCAEEQTVINLGSDISIPMKNFGGFLLPRSSSTITTKVEELLIKSAVSGYRRNVRSHGQPQSLKR